MGTTWIFGRCTLRGAGGRNDILGMDIIHVILCPSRGFVSLCVYGTEFYLSVNEVGVPLSDLHCVLQSIESSCPRRSLSPRKTKQQDGRGLEGLGRPGRSEFLINLYV